MAKNTAFGTTIRIGRGTATMTWHTVIDFDNVVMPTFERPQIETTKIDTPAGQRDFIANPRPNFGDFTFDISYEPDSAQDELFESLMAATNERVQVEIQTVGMTEPRRYAAVIKAYSPQALDDEAEMIAAVAFTTFGRVTD